jgi:hypothetical protein
MEYLHVPKDNARPMKKKAQTWKHEVLDQLIDELDCSEEAKSTVTSIKDTRSFRSKRTSYGSPICSLSTLKVYDVDPEEYEKAIKRIFKDPPK